jgi:hypothetical protein
MSPPIPWADCDEGSRGDHTEDEAADVGEERHPTAAIGGWVNQ